ncbi:MAG: hypothetical protein V7K47_20415 [Nostoc sp.]
MLKTVEHSYLLKNKQQSAQESWLLQEHDELTKARTIAEESRIVAEIAQLNAKKAWAMAELAQLNMKTAWATAKLAQLNMKTARARAELVILKYDSYNREISK